jgi:hypothetical protein
VGRAGQPRDVEALGILPPNDRALSTIHEYTELAPIDVRARRHSCGGSGDNWHVLYGAARREPGGMRAARPAGKAYRGVRRARRAVARVPYNGAYHRACRSYVAKWGL